MPPANGWGAVAMMAQVGNRVLQGRPKVCTESPRASATNFQKKTPPNATLTCCSSSCNHLGLFASQDNEILEQITRDVVRTHPDMQFFTGESEAAELHRQVGQSLGAL